MALILLVLGFLSRLLSLPLMGTMVVAIITVRAEEVTGLGDLLRLSEWMYLVFFAWLALCGPGRVSLDHLLSPRLFGDDRSA